MSQQFGMLQAGVEVRGEAKFGKNENTQWINVPVRYKGENRRFTYFDLVARKDNATKLLDFINDNKLGVGSSIFVKGDFYINQQEDEELKDSEKRFFYKFPELVVKELVILVDGVAIIDKETAVSLVL